ncbi:MAG: response regulator [Bacteroidales bacterium]|nr:response regulator [Bacteroidales bacterium]
MKVLIVEDDYPSREYLINLIGLEGFDFKAAENGKEALEIYKYYDPDVIISDIQMPYMDGLELLSAIRKDKSDTIFIITTAFGSEDYAIEALRRGANNYLKKPIRKNSLLSLLEKYKSLVESHKLAEKAQGRIIKKDILFEFDTNISHIPAIISQLISEMNVNLDDSEITNIELGLDELITNALEHGNLAISFNEKVEASNNNTMQELYAQKMKIQEYAQRKLRVYYKLRPEYCEWLIEDEGKGFDWRLIPDPTQSTQLMELNGRGIFITHFLFDEMEYLGKGNKVRVRKNFKN